MVSNTFPTSLPPISAEENEPGEPNPRQSLLGSADRLSEVVAPEDRKYGTTGDNNLPHNMTDDGSLRIQANDEDPDSQA